METITNEELTKCILTVAYLNSRALTNIQTELRNLLTSIRNKDLTVSPTCLIDHELKHEYAIRKTLAPRYEQIIKSRIVTKPTFKLIKEDVLIHLHEKDEYKELLLWNDVSKKYVDALRVSDVKTKTTVGAGVICGGVVMTRALLFTLSMNAAPTTPDDNSV